MEENMNVIRDLKTFCFSFDLSKDVDKNLKHEIEFIKKSETEQLLLKYKHGNNIHEHGKQKNK